MTLHLYDHVLAAVLSLGLPLLGYFDFLRLRRMAPLGAGAARLRAYRKLLVEQWLLFAVVLALWMWLDRPFLDLGLVPAKVEWWRLFLGTSVALAGLILLEQQRRMAEDDPEAREAIQAELEPLRPLLPHSRDEARWFRAVSITAGICEELLYRGFLLAYLGATMPVGAAVALASLIFGFGHIYQGHVGMAKTGALGAVFCGLYLLTGSLFIPMMVHVAIDWINGDIANSVLRRGSG